MNNWLSLVPLIVFLLIALGLSFYARRRSASEQQGFIKGYFIGNRALGGFVLAMTTIATYGSVSTFVGGPGQAWSIGWGWVYMAVVQVTALILLYGIMGKKMALVSRKLDAVTVVDVVRARYGSDLLANISAVVIVVFFIAIMVAQFVGGAKLFEYVTGYSYVVGLVLFGLAVIIFTVIGGFRGVAATDALCGIAMLVGMVVLGAGLISAGGGFETIMNTIRVHNPGALEPFGGGSMPASLYFTQWLLVGLFTLVLPQSVVRTMGYKDTQSLHKAMVWGTVIIGAMMIGVTSLGVLAGGVLLEDLATYGGSVDNIIPQAIVSTLPPIIAGVAIIGPIAASISTVSSLLISSASALINDMYLNWRGVQEGQIRGAQNGDKALAIASQAVTLLIGVLVFVLSVVPPDIIFNINMFAFGGLETGFLFVMVCGLFWKRANKTGAIWSMVGGVAVYCLTMALGFKIFGLHQIVIGVSVAGLLMVVGSLVGKHAQGARMDVFFPES